MNIGKKKKKKVKGPFASATLRCTYCETYPGVFNYDARLTLLDVMPLLFQHGILY